MQIKHIMEFCVLKNYPIIRGILSIKNHMKVKLIKSYNIYIIGGF